MQENTIPWIIKVVPAVVGAILALVLSGDIDKNGKIAGRNLELKEIQDLLNQIVTK